MKNNFPFRPVLLGKPVVMNTESFLIDYKRFLTADSKRFVIGYKRFDTGNGVEFQIIMILSGFGYFGSCGYKQVTGHAKRRHNQQKMNGKRTDKMPTLRKIKRAAKPSTSRHNLQHI
ncbi:MAG: hypothetical protein IPN29_03160 [Saprospiraceae bacterium]|nr:hypothetical protein [Saprospiraceae bacterium]